MGKNSRATLNKANIRITLEGFPGLLSLYPAREPLFEWRLADGFWPHPACHGYFDDQQHPEEEQPPHPSVSQPSAIWVGVSLMPTTSTSKVRV